MQTLKASVDKPLHSLILERVKGAPQLSPEDVANLQALQGASTEVHTLVLKALEELWGNWQVTILVPSISIGAIEGFPKGTFSAYEPPLRTPASHREAPTALDALSTSMSRRQRPRNNPWHGITVELMVGEKGGVAAKVEKENPPETTHHWVLSPKEFSATPQD